MLSEMLRSGSVVIAALLICVPARLVGQESGEVPRATAPAEVVVLSTLHQLHPQVPGYGFDDLSRIIERLAPDVLAVELTAEDLAERKEQRAKQEYPRSVYPLLERHDYQLVPLEPSEPLFSEMVRPNLESSKAFTERTPETARAFGAHSKAVFDYLMRYWDSPAAVNSSTTDALFEVKHTFQDAVMPPEQAAGWEAWNQHFLERIVEAAQAHPGRRIVVLVGAEHGYWLRQRLRNQPQVDLLDTEALLQALPVNGR